MGTNFILFIWLRSNLICPIITIDPADAETYFCRAFVKHCLAQPTGDQNKAAQFDILGDLNTAIDLGLETAAVYYNRGQAKKAVGDADGARADFAKANALDPSFEC